jgi:hypothetical protein
VFLLTAKFSVSLATLLRSLTARLKNLRPVFLGRVDAAFKQMFREHFESSGEGLWQPLTARTIARKQLKWPSRADLILRASDTLFDSLVSDTTHTVMQVGFTSYRRGTDLSYAIPHQLGIGVPLRQVIPDPLPASFVQKIRAIVQDYLMTGRA